MIIEKAGMAWLGKVLAVNPIEGADKIQQTEVVCGEGGKWTGVTTKDVQVGYTVVVFLPDAVVPQIEPLAFMEKHKWIVRPCRLRGCPSEVLIIPEVVFAAQMANWAVNTGIVFVGMDMTAMLGVKKYEKDIPTNIAGDVYGNFPSFIPKTDELNFQAVPEFRKALIGKQYFASEKYDGSSLTIYHNNGHIGVCSRNLELKESPKNTGWQIVERYRLKEKLPEFGNIALQMEIIGAGIQKNPLKLSHTEVRVFDIYDVDNGEYLSWVAANTISNVLGIPFAKWIYQGKYPDYTDNELREMANGGYVDVAMPREGLVFRPTQTMRVDGRRLSFTVLNLDYKH